MDTKNLCEICKKELAEDEYNYSLEKYNRPLCRQHQKTNDMDYIEKRIENPDIKIDNNYRYNMIKGRIAEALIEELFLALGYNVFRYGMENTVPGIMELLKGIRGDVADNIKRMPDFVIQQPTTKEVFFIEVKFRANETFRKYDLPKDYPFTNCYFIIVSRKHIKCITYNELVQNKEVTPESDNYLGSRKEFQLDKDTIIEFCSFAIKFFENV